MLTFKSFSICPDTYSAIHFSLPKFKSEVKNMLNLGGSGFNRYLSRANFATSQAYDLYPTSVSPPKQQSKKESKKAQNVVISYPTYTSRLLKLNQSRSKDLEGYASHYVNHDMFPYNQPTSPWRYRDSKSLKYVQNIP